MNLTSFLQDKQLTIALRGEVILRSVPPQPMKVLRASGIERIATLEDERSLVHES